MDWFKIGKGVCQGCLFNFYSEYIVWNAGLDESQAGIKTAGRNINNLRYADDTIHEVERGECKSWLKLNIQKTMIMASVLSLHGK